MSQAIKKLTKEDVKIISLSIDLGLLTAKMSDGRIVSIPIDWFPRLSNASLTQLKKFQISPGGYGISWPEIDEDISIKAFIS